MYTGETSLRLTTELWRRVHGRLDKKAEWAYATDILSHSLLCVGKFADAEYLLRETLTDFALLRVNTWDPQNNMIDLRKQLAYALDNQEKYTDAQAIFERCISLLIEHHGPDNKWVLQSAKALGNNLRCQGKYVEAVPILRDALKGAKRVFGPEEVATLDFSVVLAMTLDSQDKHDEAQAMYLEILPVIKRLLGPDHMDVLQASHNYAASLVSSGRLAEAEVTFAECLEARKRVLGIEHPTTIHNAETLTRVRAEM
jgi:tetratricopeptide (TPR) repeat protein